MVTYISSVQRYICQNKQCLAEVCEAWISIQHVGTENEQGLFWKLGELLEEEK